jgi:CrcB protein
MTLLVVAVAGALGAPARYVLEQTISARAFGRWPWGTLLVNISGSFVLGLVAGSALHGLPRTAVATGFLGAYTTFSGYAYETIELAQCGETRRSASYAAITIVASTAVAWLGLLVTG